MDSFNMALISWTVQRVSLSVQLLLETRSSIRLKLTVLGHTGITRILVSSS